MLFYNFISLSFCEFCNYLTFYEIILGQSGYFKTGSCRIRLLKVVSIDGINLGKIVHVPKKHSALDNMRHITPSGMKNSGNIFKNTFCLFLDTIGCFTGFWVNPCLPGNKN